MKKINRRDMLLGGASLVALGGAAAYTRVMRSKPVVRETGPEIPAFIPERDLEGLTHPMKAYAKIGNVELSRLILGGNMIGGWAHARDMGFYGRLVKAYFTDERVFRNFRIAEACGVNTILTNPALMRVINRYWREEGGKIKFISDCGYPGGVVKGAIASVENGASMVYLHGGHADNNAVVKKDWKFFREYLDESRKLGVPVGIGCHSLQTVQFCMEHDCIPDFWMKTVHKVDYPTAHLNEDRKKNATGLGSCDNRFGYDAGGGVRLHGLASRAVDRVQGPRCWHRASARRVSGLLEGRRGLHLLRHVRLPGGRGRERGKRCVRERPSRALPSVARVSGFLKTTKYTKHTKGTRSSKERCHVERKVKNAVLDQKIAIPKKIGRVQPV